MLSIIIPTFNEVKNQYIQRSFPLLATLEDVEIIIADAGSSDETLNWAKKFDFQILHTQKNSRLARIQAGIKAAQGEMILMHHPRSIVSKEGYEALKGTKASWGAFRHRFDHKNPLLRFTSWWSNYGRGKRGIFYMDHCIFLRENLKHLILDLPDRDIFEDTEICKILLTKSWPKLLPFYATTSAIRFRQNGLIKQILLNQKMKWMYYLKKNHKDMNKNYEKNLDLNSKYEP